MVSTAALAVAGALHGALDSEAHFPSPTKTAVSSMSSPRSVIAQAATEKRHATWQETLQQAKKKHRPKLADWTRDGLSLIHISEPTRPY